MEGVKVISRFFGDVREPHSGEELEEDFKKWREANPSLRILEHKIWMFHVGGLACFAVITITYICPEKRDDPPG